MNNKRGIENLHEKIFTILILLFIFATLLYFINQQSSGKLTEKQVLAKEICLTTLSAKSGTNIIVEHSSELVILNQDNGIFINDKQGIIAKGYFYDCYGNFEINSLEDGKIEIVIK